MEAYILRRSLHDIGSSNLKTETHVGHTRGDHDDPQNLNRSKREDGDASRVLERKTDEKSASLCNVLGQDVQDELLDIVKHATTLFHSIENGSKVVIRQYNIRSLLGNIRTGLTHGNTDISTFQGWRIIDTITRHGDEALAAMKGLNHADLGLGSAARNNKRQNGELVNFLIS